MSASSLTSHRPRLEPAHDGTGPVPYFLPRPPEPVDPEPVEGVEGHPSLMVSSSNHLRARLDTAFATARAACRLHAEEPQLRVVARRELVAINADLAAVVAINAALPHHYRGARVATWPTPLFREQVLHSWRDLHGALAAAALVLGAAEAHDNTWFARHA